jgi:hypothetical protein
MDPYYTNPDIEDYDSNGHLASAVSFNDAQGFAGAKSPTGHAADATGRALHSSTSQLNLSRVESLKPQ